MLVAQDALSTLEDVRVHVASNNITDSQQLIDAHRLALAGPELRTSVPCCTCWSLNLLRDLNRGTHGPSARVHEKGSRVEA